MSKVEKTESGLHASERARILESRACVCSLVYVDEVYSAIWHGYCMLGFLCIFRKEIFCSCSFERFDFYDFRETR